MTAITATVSDKLDFEDAVQIKAAIEAVTSTNTNDRFILVQGANNKARVVKLNIE